MKLWCCWVKSTQLVFVCWWKSGAFKPKPQTAAELHSRFVLTEWDALVLTHRRRAATAACRHLTTPSRPSGGGVRLGGWLEPHRRPEDGLGFRFSPNRTSLCRVVVPKPKRRRRRVQDVLTAVSEFYPRNSDDLKLHEVFFTLCSFWSFETNKLNWWSHF